MFRLQVPFAFAFVFLLLLTSGLVFAVESSGIVYTFQEESGGGVAELPVDPETKKFSGSKVLYQSPSFRVPAKLRKHPENGAVIATSAGTDPGNVILLSPGGGEPVLLDLSHEPDEVRAVGGGDTGVRPSFLLGGKDGLLCLIDSETGDEIARKIARKDLEPPANQPEDLFVLPGADSALVSFQKDSKSGRHQGSRIIHFGIPHLDILGDVALPRDRTDLHLENDIQQQGPGPEVILSIPRKDTAVFSLDLYGGVAFCSLSQLMQGQLENHEVVSTSRNREFGTAFPDRMTNFSIGDKDFLFVSNASGEGVAILSVDKREVVQRFDFESGLETPILLSGGRRLASVQSGKLKSVADGVVGQVRKPVRKLLIFEVQDSETEPLKMREVSLSGEATLLAVPDPTGAGDTLVVVEKSETGSDFVLVDAASGEILDRQAATGMPQRLITK